MADEFTPEDLEILDDIHAQLKHMSQLLEHQHARFMARLDRQHDTDMARFDRIDRLLAQLIQSMTAVNENPRTPCDSSSAGGKNSSMEAVSNAIEVAVPSKPLVAAILQTPLAMMQQKNYIISNLSNQPKVPIETIFAVEAVESLEIKQIAEVVQTKNDFDKPVIDLLEAMTMTTFKTMIEPIESLVLTSSDSSIKDTGAMKMELRGTKSGSMIRTATRKIVEGTIGVDKNHGTNTLLVFDPGGEIHNFNYLVRANELSAIIPTKSKRYSTVSQYNASSSHFPLDVIRVETILVSLSPCFSFIVVKDVCKELIESHLSLLANICGKNLLVVALESIEVVDKWMPIQIKWLAVKNVLVGIHKVWGYRFFYLLFDMLVAHDYSTAEMVESSSLAFACFGCYADFTIKKAQTLYFFMLESLVILHARELPIAQVFAVSKCSYLDANKVYGSDFYSVINFVAREFLWGIATFWTSIEIVEFDSCCHWLKELFHYAYLERKNHVLIVPKQGTTLMKSLEDIKFSLTFTLCFLLGILATLATYSPTLCFQKWPAEKFGIIGPSFHLLAFKDELKMPISSLQSTIATEFFLHTQPINVCRTKGVIVKLMMVIDITMFQDFRQKSEWLMVKENNYNNWTMTTMLLINLAQLLICGQGILVLFIMNFSPSGSWSAMILFCKTGSVGIIIYLGHTLFVLEIFQIKDIKSLDVSWAKQLFNSIILQNFGFAFLSAVNLGVQQVVINYHLFWCVVVSLWTELIPSFDIQCCANIILSLVQSVVGFYMVCLTTLSNGLASGHKSSSLQFFLPWLIIVLIFDCLPCLIILLILHLNCCLLWPLNFPFMH